MKMYGGLELKLQALLNSSLYVGEWCQFHAPAALPPRKKTLKPTEYETGYVTDRTGWTGDGEKK
jgi:hypothetical protein